MISLVQLLKEVQGQPKAIFIAGPAGSGKTTVLNQLGLQDFKVINVDDVYEKLLKNRIRERRFYFYDP
jgi:dephospho-CoA kinase